MAYLRNNNFDLDDDLGRSALRTNLDSDDYYLRKRIERATESYSPPLTFVRDEVSGDQNLEFTWWFC